MSNNNNKMLVDASHPEETRVVVLRGNRIEEFDFESASKKPLRGNIYLAKVTRVEPSLQAAFVDYGGNRHGFLAFSEIHPDYYQIPVADRQALLEEEAREQQAEAEEEEARPAPRGNGRRRRSSQRSRRTSSDAAKIASDPVEDDQTSDTNGSTADDNAGDTTPGDATPAEEGQAASPAVDEAVTPAVEVEPALVEADKAPDGETVSVEPGAQTQDKTDNPETGPASEPEENTTAVTGDVAQEAEQDRENSAETGEPATQALDQKPETEDDDASQFDATAAQPDANRDDAGSPPQTPDEMDGASLHAEEDQEPSVLETNSSSDSQQPDSEEIPTGVVGREGDDKDDTTGDSADETIDSGTDEDDADSSVENLGGDTEDDVPRAPRRNRRQYKIQEVIKRRQILLVQVVKEERGNKGAALTSYLSLAGRYSVLMPNTARGGGISRKITDSNDRRRMKDIAQELEVPEGMGVILRTAGAARTKAEVRRDFEYLLRLWESVREMTLQSSAPALVYEEGSLIKRSIRDLYGKGIDEILVAGEEGHREAKDFMKMLMPAHVKNVKLWTDPHPLFAKCGVEQQLDAMFSANVSTKSGGYIVINQTEALVAIDVNSGRSTREHNIEDTALRTNLEAADEIARQLRLRDLAGLIVIDFIDMEENRNNRAVERRLKEALKSDRARIQVGHISHFGLLEMSRQRMRTGVLEGSSIVCPFCQGGGTVRSTASIALHVLRLIEDALIRNSSYNLIVKSRSDVALYMLNQKRSHLTDLENRFGVALIIEADDNLPDTSYHSIERGEPAAPPPAAVRESLDFTSAVQTDESGEGSIEPATEEDDDAVVAEISGEEETESESDQGERRRRRRRRGRGRDRTAPDISAEDPQPSDEGLAAYSENAHTPARGQSGQPGAEAEEGQTTGDDTADQPPGLEARTDDTERPRRRRRGFRGRRRGGERPEPDAGGETDAEASVDRSEAVEDNAIRRPHDQEGGTGRRPRRGAWVRSSDESGTPTDTDTPPAIESEGADQSGVDTNVAVMEPENAEVVDEAVSMAAEPTAPPADDAPAPADSGDAPALSAEPAGEAMETKSVVTRPAEPQDSARENGALQNDMNGADEAQPAPEHQNENRDEGETEKPSRKREIELLPEAPPPAKKRGGWWQK